MDEGKINSGIQGEYRIISKVIGTCSTKEQLDSARNMADNFLEKWRAKIDNLPFFKKGKITSRLWAIYTLLLSNLETQNN